MPDPLVAARDAIAEGAWDAALAGLDAVAHEAGGPEGIELRAQALYGAGDFEGSVAAWEELHAHHVAAGDHAEAARAAAMVALYLMMDTGLMAPVRGWLERAVRLLDGAEAPAAALIAMVRTYERFMTGDMDEAAVQSELATSLGERFGVAPAVVIGRVAAARIRILRGELREGLAELDEIAALLMSGTVDPLTTGMMYCELICAAQGLALPDRAAEWTEVMERWRHGAAFGGINGRCRVHRAEMLRLTGPCDAAEEEALGACEELRPWMRREFGWPLVELGTIRLRRGDLAGAEAAFVEALDHAWSPQPGLALLRLAQGDVVEASVLIADAVAHPFEIPSKERPPFGDLRLAPLLDAQVEIAAATGDGPTARLAAQRLRTIADRFPSPSLAAAAHLAEGRVALLEGDHDRALRCCEAAVAGWTDVGAPYEVGCARVELGRALVAAGRPARARQEWNAAQRGFEGFGALGRARAVEELTASERPATPSRDALGGRAVFRRDGDTRTVVLGDTTVVVRELKGFRHLERLLAEPNREFHVLDLVAAEQGVLRPDRDQPGLPVLDDTAREAYRRRLAEVEADIDEASAANDPARVELAERDRAYLVAELRSAVGLGGRSRVTGGSAERARTSVARTLRYALDRLAEHHPAAAGHLRRHVRTGTYCVYEPDPVAPVEWTV